MPCRRKGCIPHLGRRVRVDLGLQSRDRLSRLGVKGGQRPAAKEVVLPGFRTACGIDLVEGGEEAGQVGRETVEIPDSIHGQVLSREPLVHRPRPREPAPGNAFRQRPRDRKRQLWREDRQPPVLLVDLRDVPIGARQSNRQVLAEPEGRVVPAIEFDGRHRKVSPVREVSRDQAGHELRRDGGFLHGRHCLSGRAGEGSRNCGGEATGPGIACSIGAPSHSEVVRKERLSGLGAV